MSSDRLFFGKGNAKIADEILTFSLPSGYTCPGACACLAKADRLTGKLHTVRKSATPNSEEFRCFSASQEAIYKGARDARWRNMELLQVAFKVSMAAGADLIEQSLPRGPVWVRVHVAGDFFSQDYFDAWMEVARRNPDSRFYAYTKSLPYWTARVDDIPANFALTASMGGKYDNLIGEYDLRYAKVVFHPDEAVALGLEIDHDDTHAQVTGPSFALLIHGAQEKGSKAAEAQKRMRSEDLKFSYNSETKNVTAPAFA